MPQTPKDSAAKDREAIACFLYEESRVKRFRAGDYTPMWHELEGVEQADWLRVAARLQQALKDSRRLRRMEASRA